jgi:hypothetical protein
VKSQKAKQNKPEYFPIFKHCVYLLPIGSKKDAWDKIAIFCNDHQKSKKILHI